MLVGIRGLRGTAAASLPVAVALVVAGLLAPAAGHAERAAPRVVGGTPVPITAAPFTVLVEQQTASGGTGVCTGSIIDPTRVLTAAHCIVDEANATVPPARVRVAAGTSDIRQLDPGTQVRQVTAMRREPTYAPSIPQGAGAGDVAVLEVAEPFAYGPTVQPIGIAEPGAGPAPGSTFTLAGFGRQSAGADPDGKLHTTTLTVTDPAGCAGPDSALIICASSPTSTACSGDSGGGIVAGGVLVGVVSGGDLSCPPGGEEVFSNLVAPQLGAFVRGNDAPPQAPRGTTDRAQSVRTSYDGAQVGATITCTPGVWSNAPTFTYAFEDATTGAAVRQGPSNVHVVEPADVGKRLRCRVIASNAGGTGSIYTTPSPAITALPPGATAPRVSVSASRSFVRRRAKLRIRTTVAAGSGAVGRGQVCLTLPRRTSVSALGGGTRAAGRRVCWAVERIARGQSATYAVTVKVARRGRASFTSRLARAGASTPSATRRVRVR